MSKQIKTIFMASAILCTSPFYTSCNDSIEESLNMTELTEAEESGEKAPEIKTITITASNTISRTSHVEEGEGNLKKIKVRWETGDVIYVGSPASDVTGAKINDSNSGFKPFTIVEGSISEDGHSASFTGDVPANFNGKLLAFYGVADNIKIDNGKVIFDFTNHTQSSTDMTHLSNYDYMNAVTDYSASSESAPNFSFKHMGAVLKVNINGLGTEQKTLKSVTLSYATPTIFVSSIEFDKDGNITENKTNVQNITLNLNDQKSNAGTIGAIFTLAPTSLSGEMSVSANFTKASGNYIYKGTMTADASLEAGKYYQTVNITTKADNTVTGDGTESSPYIIDNFEKFNSFSFYRNNDPDPLYVNLNSDIDAGGKAINDKGVFTKGIFDGKGHTIKNFTLNKVDDKSQIGLFINNLATIKNLTLENVTLIKTKFTDVTSINTRNIGILVAKNSPNGIIENCTIKNCKIDVTTPNNNDLNTDYINIGMLTGMNQGSVKECRVTNDNSITITEGSGMRFRAGGMIGYNYKSKATEYLFVDEMNITSNGTGAGLHSSTIGELMGHSSLNTIKGCYSKAKITVSDLANTSEFIIIGGLIGNVHTGNNGTTTIIGCYSAGEIICSNKNKYAGFVTKGTKDTATPANGKIDISQCYSTTKLKITGNDNPNYAFLFNTWTNGITIKRCYFVNHKQNPPIDGIGELGVAELKASTSEFNTNSGLEGYTFVEGTDQEPLVITKVSK